MSDGHRFRVISAAIFILGFATFSLLYGPQPLLPAISDEFQITPAEASGMVSVTTIALAILLIPFGMISDRIGRKTVMVACLFIASLLSLLIGLTETFWQALILRALTGCALAGVPAVAMAYLAEEIPSEALARAVGLYVAGNAIGGLSGRILASALETAFSWKAALVIIGAIGIGVALLLLCKLPASERFNATGPGMRSARDNVIRHLRDRELLYLFGFGFMLMGTFAAVYNYLGYWLQAPPFSLSPLYASWIFLFYLLGPPASIRTSRLSVRFGKPRMLGTAIALLSIGLLTMLSMRLSVLAGGLAVFTVGYFMAYSTVGTWVTARAGHAKAAATSLYLCFFYAGGSFIGTGAGLMWGWGAWHGVVALLLILMILLAALLRLSMSVGKQDQSRSREN